MNVDQAVDRNRAPERRARAADHLDLLEIAQENLLHIPEDAGEKWRVKCAAVEQDLELAVVGKARADGLSSLTQVVFSQ